MFEPHEVFHVPPAFVGCYAGDIDEGSYSLHRFIIEKLRPRVPAGYPDPTLAYNLYLDAGGNQATEADVLRSVANVPRHRLRNLHAGCDVVPRDRRLAMGSGPVPARHRSDRAGGPRERHEAGAVVRVDQRRHLR